MNQADVVEIAAGHEMSTPYDMTAKTSAQKADEKSEIANVTYTGSQDEDEDSKHPDSPTEDDMLTLRRVPGKVPWTSYTIAFVELCERFSYYGS